MSHYHDEEKWGTSAINSRWFPVVSLLGIVNDSAFCLQTGYCALVGLSDAELLLSMYRGLWVYGRDGLPFWSVEPLPDPFPVTLNVSPACVPLLLFQLATDDHYQDYISMWVAKCRHLAGHSDLDVTHPVISRQTVLLCSTLWGHPSSTLLLWTSTLYFTRKVSNKKEEELLVSV